MQLGGERFLWHGGGVGRRADVFGFSLGMNGIFHAGLGSLGALG